MYYVPHYTTAYTLIIIITKYINVYTLLTIIDDRYKLKSTIFTSQLPVKSWHTYLGEPTVADAILDRVLSQAIRIDLRGKSLRWKGSTLEDDSNSTEVTN